MADVSECQQLEQRLGGWRQAAMLEARLKPVRKAALEVGRAEQLLSDRQCQRPSVRFDQGKEQNARCVPDMRYFASALATHWPALPQQATRELRWPTANAAACLH